MSNPLLDHLLTRRSALTAFLEAPAPSEEQVHQMLTAAARVPDHKKLVPWRFIRFDRAACETLGLFLAERWQEIEPEADADRLALEQDRFLRAPMVIGVVSSARADAPVPHIEQVLSAGAVCMNLVHAAYAYGFHAQWLTEWYAFDEKMREKLGLSDEEQIAGFIHIGSYQGDLADRPRPDLAAIVTHWEE